jgi:hypothetical protein
MTIEQQLAVWMNQQCGLDFNSALFYANVSRQLKEGGEEIIVKVLSDRVFTHLLLRRARFAQSLRIQGGK